MEGVKWGGRVTRERYYRTNKDKVEALCCVCVREGKGEMTMPLIERGNCLKEEGGTDDSPTLSLSLSGSLSLSLS